MNPARFDRSVPGYIGQVAFANVEQAVTKHARGARNPVDEVSRRGGLGRGKDFTALRLGRVSRRPGSLALDLDERSGVVAQQSNRGCREKRL